jgi:hypothetical protein
MPHSFAGMMCTQTLQALEMQRGKADNGAESREQRAESREQRAESREQRAESGLRLADVDCELCGCGGVAALAVAAVQLITDRSPATAPWLKERGRASKGV